MATKFDPNDYDPCKPYWEYTQFKKYGDAKCPYGKTLIGDVTLPDDLNGFEALSIFWGYTPFIAVGLMIIWMLWKRGTRQLSFCLCIAFMFLMNQIVLKKLISQPRPGQEPLG